MVGSGYVLLFIVRLGEWLAPWVHLTTIHQIAIQWIAVQKGNFVESGKRRLWYATSKSLFA